FFFSSRRRHTRWPRDWSSDVCSSDLSWLSPSLRDRVWKSVALQRRIRAPVLGLASPVCRHVGSHREFPGSSQLGLEVFQGLPSRSEERRVGKECRSWLVSDHEKKKV